jgi:hypothetical protein
MDDFWTLGGAPRGGERPVTSVGAWLLSRFDRLPVRARRDDPFLTPTGVTPWLRLDAQGQHRSGTDRSADPRRIIGQAGAANANNRWATGEPTARRAVT